MNFEIRPLSEEDVPAAAEIERECFSKPWSENTLSAELKNPLNGFFGAFLENELVGYIGFQNVAGEANVFNVAVLPCFRRNGLGRALVERIITAAKAAGADVIYLEVRAGNIPAINLYEKAGFVFCGIRKNYYDAPKENAILMRLAFDGTQESEDPIECWEDE